MNDDKIRLGFIGDRSVFVGDDGLWTTAGVGRVVEALQERCGQMTIALSRAPAKVTFHDHRLRISKDDFLPLPWVPSIAKGFFKVLSFRRTIREVERRSDVVIVQLPLAATWSLSNPQRPRVYQVCADLRQVVATSTWYRGPKRIAAYLAAWVIDRNQSRLIAQKNARMIAHGDELARHYGLEHGRAAVSATILEQEILSVPRRRPMNAPLRILFVGFLRHEKGVDTLLTAFRRVLTEIPNAELEIVGGRDTVDQGIAGQLARELDELGHTATVLHHGHLSFGPQLFQILADADVLVVPSRSEGTPRVLVEARAFGCTVIGSAVGGIPTSIDDGVDGLLVPPNDPEALCAALLRIARDGLLRERLVAGGIERARRCTVEAFAKQIYEEALRLDQKPRSPAANRDPVLTKLVG
jgi:glycosyltransferase involved in cell wall biosynthesis